MGTMASQITSLRIVYSTVYTGADQRKHQNSVSLALCGEFIGERWIPRTIEYEYKTVRPSCIYNGHPYSDLTISYIVTVPIVFM